MADRLFGTRKSPRRSRWVFLTLLLVACTALMAITGAQAVHDTGRFQLDGDAATGTNTANTPTATDDWDKVCFEVARRPVAQGGGGLSIPDATAKCGIGTGTTGPATESSWVEEPNLNSTIFTGGGSKDPQDVNQWAWKDGAGGLPDKDNLLHAYAARYSLPPDATHCPAGTFATCDLLFFGLDRYDNSGDAQNGFWFFQKKIDFGTNAVGGGTGFIGSHTPGDVLVVSDFSNGGTTATITVYTWDPTCTATNKPASFCADANLHTQATSSAAKCDALPPGSDTGDRFCGIVNPSTIIMPWSFTDKSGTANNGAINGEFYEAGINLSALNLAGQCFSSVLSESRSSTSTTATLKDFVLGQLGTCAPTPSTQVQKDGVNFNGTVAPGTPVRDTATITVTGATSPDDATGTVDFFLCGPTASATDCTTGGTSAGADKALTDTSSPANTKDGISGATSDLVNTAASPLASGYYCFRIEADVTNYDDPAPATNSTTECFSVSQPTSVSTLLHQTDAAGADVSPANNGLTITINAGGYVKDVGTVTPSSATGSVAFKYYSSLADCNADTNGTAAGGGAVSSGTSTSNVVQFNSSGTFYWRAFFTGTGLSLDSSSPCNEILTVNQPTSVSTFLHETNAAGTDVSPANNGLTITINVGGYVKDVATVTPSSATGSVAFKYYSSLADCNADTNGTAAGGGAVSSGTSTSNVVQFNSSGTVYWRAFFTGTGLSLNSSSPCNEIVTVNQPTSVSTLLHETNAAGTDVSPANNALTITIQSGGYVKDVATVTPSSATGSVAFKYYSSLADCNADTNGTAAGGGTVSSGTSTSNVVQFPNPGTFYWRAFLTGTGLTLNSSSPCNEILTVRQTRISTSPAVYPNDSATITVANGGALTGNVVFSLYDTSANCTAGGTTGRLFTETVPLPAGASLSKQVSTHNGDPSDAVADYAHTDLADTTLYWRVTYGGNADYQGRNSICTESTRIDHTADASGGTAP